MLATGLGKTRTASEVFRLRRPAGRCLFLAHREELLQQASAAITRDARLLCELERAESKAVVRGMIESDVVVGSVATLHKRRLQRWPREMFQTIIVDEAHHATAAGYRAILEHFHEAKVLGLTATPDRSDGVGLHNVFESCAYRYDIRDGIRDGYLSPIRCRKIVVGKLDISKVRVTAGDLNAGDLERALQVEGVIHQIASPLVEEAKGRPTIAFCPTVAVAEELARVLAGYVGADRVAVISAQTSRGDRERILSEYKSGRIQYLTNCAVLTEGFDAPSTSVIAMCRPTKSRALYTQCVGRGTRLAEGKDHCLVLDFCPRNRRRDLTGPEDVLAGDDLEDAVKEILEKRLSDSQEAAGDLDDLIAEATAAAEAAERRAADERRRARLAIAVPYAREELDLFPEHSALLDTAEKTLKAARSGQSLATREQRAFLERYGIAVPADTSKKSAGDLSTYVHKRGMLTFKQARLLAKHKLRIDLTKTEANSLINRLAANHWRVTPDIVAQYGAVS